MSEKKELQVSYKEFGLQEKEAKDLTKGLPTILKERDVLIDAYEDMIEQEITEETIPLFRALRLQIRDNRTKGIIPWHKKSKDYFLNGGRFVDSIKNKEIEVNERMESKLLEAEKYFENLEKQRLEELQQKRVKELEPYLEDAHERDLSCMEEDVWQSYLKTKKDDYEARLEAERKAEEERKEQERLAELARIEREKEIEAQRIENERLKKETEEKEKQIELERKKARLEAERLEAKRLAELKAEREKQAKLQAELEAKRLAELKAERERKEAERLAKLEAERLAKAPIKNQLQKWVDGFELPKTDVDNETSKLIKDKFVAFKKWSKEQINNI